MQTLLSQLAVVVTTATALITWRLTAHHCRRLPERDLAQNPGDRGRCGQIFATRPTHMKFERHTQSPKEFDLNHTCHVSDATQRSRFIAGQGNVLVPDPGDGNTVTNSTTSLASTTQRHETPTTARKSPPYARKVGYHPS